jgi:hypothetical protein
MEQRVLAQAKLDAIEGLSDTYLRSQEILSSAW